MLQVDSTQAIPVSASGAAVPDTESVHTQMPPQPKNVRDTGLELSLIVELVAKAMHASGKMHLPVLAGKLRLSINVLREVLGFMLAEQLVKVAFRGDSDLDVHYQLTEAGKIQASDYLARCRYAGPAPVTLNAYRERVKRQLRAEPGSARISAADMASAFAEDIIEPGVLELIGAALQSSRALLLHGPSGSGKSMLARKLGQLCQDVVAVPYAILVDQNIIQFYDPLAHLPPSPMQSRQAENRRSVDHRWVLCQRPLMQVGSEFDTSMLDLRYDAAAGVYHAPPHLMANNGMFLIDDFGRQRLSTADLLNRFSSPLDSGCDQFTMNGGKKISIPFDVTLVLATNLPLHLLLDESSMRRITYKICVGALSETNYRLLLLRQCTLARIDWDGAAVDHLITRLHRGSGRALLASIPHDLLGRLADFASFAGADPRLTVPALEQAWASMLAGGSSGALAPSQAPIPFYAASGDPLIERIS